MNKFVSLIVIFFSLNAFCSKLLYPDNSSSLYLDLIKKSLLGIIDEDPGLNNPFSLAQREAGRDWPAHAYTMIGLDGLNNIQFCLDDILKNNVSGDCIETGVWRGGATIFMRAFFKAHNITNRFIWVADSFEGLPAPNPEQYPADKDLHLNQYNNVLSITLDTVKNNFSRYGLLDNQVKFLKGWFKDTLPTVPITKLALLRLDGDLYESTMDGLVNLYPKLSIGGYIIIDDYGAIPPCAKAVNDYRAIHNIDDVIEKAGWTIIYWKKTK